MALILVIDDSAAVRRLLCDTLAGQGHAVLDASNGEAGMALFRERRPDLVITDMVMPVKEGIETIQEIRKSEQTVKILAISGSSEKSERLYLGAARKLGADATLVKPFPPAALLEVVDQLLKPAQSDSSSLTELREDLTTDIEDPRLRRLFDYWLDRKGSRRWPARRDIDPLDLGYMLGHLMLLDVVGEPLRFRVRLHGTAMTETAGYELTGKWIDELPISDYRTYVLARCEALVASGEPTVVHHNRVLDGKRRRYEALWLPFSDDGTGVTMLLCALFYQRDGSEQQG
ncbi:MAG: response regulator [Stellaceae bacterium]